MKGIIFDLDGTLWDSSEGVVAAWNEVLEKHSHLKYRMTVAKIKSYMGKPMDEIGELFLGELPLSFRNEVMHECCENENNYLSLHGGKLYPEVEKTLAELSERYALFIVSNCQSGYIETFFEYHGLEKYFTDYEDFGSTGKQKCDNIRLIIKRNAVDSAVYVGDTQGDCDSARLANVGFVHASYGFGKVSGCDASAGCFAELPEIMARLLD